MADYNFARYFIVLNANGKQSGYCKVESMNNNAVFSVSVRGAEDCETMYLAFIMKKNDKPVVAGEICTSEDGTAYKSFQTEAENVFDSGDSAGNVEACYLLSGEKNILFSGYPNRSITRNETDLLDQRVKTCCLPNEKDEIPQEEIIIEQTEEEESKNADENSTESKNTENNNTENKFASFSPYIETLRRLYEGITNGKNDKDDKAAAKTERTESSSYSELTGEYYKECEERFELSDVFGFSANNTRWYLIDNANKKLLGLTYESGHIKYVINCTPSENGLLPPYIPAKAVWLPNYNGGEIIGYWCTFVDAQTGCAVIPNFQLL